MKWNRLIANILILTFLGTMFFSLFHMSMGMEMDGGMSDCPFMSHEEVICPMSLTDRISAWKSVFTSVVPALTTLLTVAAVVVLVASTAPNLLLRVQYAILIFVRRRRERSYSFSLRPLQELFSNGILHPKLF